jgi:hypothetical protein
MNHKTGLRSCLAILLCLSAVSALLASPEKRMRPLSREEVAQAWVGISEDESEVVRLVLASDGTGRGAYVFADNPARGFEVTSWKYDPTKKTIVASLVDLSQNNIRSLDGTIVGTAMELTVRGDGWKRRYSLRREYDLQPKWQKLKDATSDLGH